MFESIIQSLLGSWGRTVLDFYLEHQLVINLVVIAYGITMIVLRRRKQHRAAESKQKENNE